MTHRTDNPTKAQFAAEASFQLVYILSTLGIQDNHRATTALRDALQSRGSLRCDAIDVAETLRRIKLAVRELVKDNKYAPRRNRKEEQADAQKHNATAHDEGRHSRTAADVPRRDRMRGRED